MNNNKKQIPEIVSLPLFSMNGELVEEVELNTAQLGGRICRDVLRQAIITYEANKRSGTAKTKTRKEVAYGGSKPWPQKGTGRARAGTRSSPIWVGGGIIHGPKVRDYTKKLNKKMKKRALASALLGKAVDEEIKLIDKFELEQGKTSEMANFLKNIGVQRSFLIVVPEHDSLLWRCTRNIPGAAMKAAYEINPYLLLKARHVIFVKEALDLVLDNLAILQNEDISENAETVEVA